MVTTRRATRNLPAAQVDGRVRAMLERVRASGLKLTPQRMAIVRELAADPTHPTAQELFERLRTALPTMSFATVYNTLDALATAGLCEALSLAPGPARFDPNMEAHHHAVCDRCGLVRDVPVRAPDGVDAGPSALAAAPGFQVRAIERIYRGLCSDCARRGGKRPRGKRPVETAASSLRGDGHHGENS
jgi:Fur family peroxide stress response transcriptional regulator